MRILHILSSNRFSGAENVVCQLISLFNNDDKYDFIFSSPDGQIRHALEERGIPFLPMREFSLKEIKRIVKKYNPDIIHAHDMRACFFTAVASPSKPLICHIHNNNYDNRKINVKSLAFLYPAMRSSRIIYVSDSCAAGYFFNKCFKSKSTVLYNIVDVAEVRRRMLMDYNKYSYDIVYLGRLSYPKNPQRMVSVINEVCKTRPSVKVAIIGSGELLEEVESLVSSLNLNNNISFLGFKDNPLKILADSKLLLMTSRWEGTPMCALESMALGVPIVATPTDGLKTLLCDGVTGFLRETNQGLVSAITELLDDVELCAKMSSNCMAESERFNDKNKYRNTVNDIYMAAIKKRINN